MHSLKIMAEIAFPARTVRFWEGSHVLLAAGHAWQPLRFSEGVEDLQMLINGQNQVVRFTLTGLTGDLSDIGFSDVEQADIVGSRMTVFVQECDARDQPVDDPEAVWTGYVVDSGFDEEATATEVVAGAWIDVGGLTMLRNLSGGTVLSDASHQASRPGDRIMDRVPRYVDHTIRWPDFG